MDILNTLEYRTFDFFDTESYIELCYDLAYVKLEAMYPQYKVDSCDCFGLYIIDDASSIVTRFSTGRLGKIGPLAMRNELTKNITVLVNNSWS